MYQNQYNNKDVLVGIQGGDNSGVIQNGNDNIANFSNNDILDEQLLALQKYVSENKSEILTMVEDLKVAKKENNSGKFKTVLGYIKDVLGPIAQVATIASTVGLTF